MTAVHSCRDPTRVAFENNVVYGKPADDRAIAIASGGKGTAVYAVPPMRVWQWPGGPTTLTPPRNVTSAFAADEVVPVGAAWRTAEKVLRPN